jgi:hypothetical protein
MCGRCEREQREARAIYEDCLRNMHDDEAYIQYKLMQDGQ